MRKVAGRWGWFVAALTIAALGLPASGPARGTEPAADLTLTNVDSPDPVQSGATLTYTVTVHNKGPDPAIDVAMTDNLPGGTTVVSATPSDGRCNPNPRKVVCRLDPLAVDATWTIAIAVSVSKKKGSLTNAASVQSGLPDPRPGDNSQSQTTTIGSPPDPPDCEGLDATIPGTEANDSLVGTEQRDVIAALGGDDVIDGLGGNDRICGGSGDDQLRGRAGFDLLRAKSGADVVRGGDDRDDVGGGTGRDSLFGGLRQDTLRGGPGRDSCHGGFGADAKLSC
jgi:uncharacterized repeat protein (TIGR01451 family)